MVSNCCGANPVYELDENMGYCSECGRGTVFQEDDGGDCSKDIQQNG